MTVNKKLQKIFTIFSVVQLLIMLFNQPGMNSTRAIEVSTPLVIESSREEDIMNNLGKSLVEELEDIKAQLAANRKEQARIKNEKGGISNQISGFEKEIKQLELNIQELNEQINEKELVIKSLQIEINLLTEQIKDLEKEIKDAQDAIVALEVETDGRLINMYLTQKQHASTSTMVFSSEGPSSIIKSDTYRNALQEDTNNKLSALEEKRIKLEKDKKLIEEKKIAQDRNRNMVKEEQRKLESQRALSDSQKGLYRNKILESQDKVNQYDKLLAILPQEEKKLLAQQDQIQSRLLSKNELIGGLPIKKGTFLGVEGNTGFSYGAHLHFGVSVDGVIQNPCSYLPSGAYGSCGGNGKVAKPLSGATLTSSFRPPSRPTHNAIDISTGGGGLVTAAHDGYVYFGFEPCGWAAVCNGGGAIYAKVCEVDKCGSGISSVYYHLRCTAEPKGSGRSCK